jgi:alcohol dehydrogenase, propanol-preferring
LKAMTIQQIGEISPGHPPLEPMSLPIPNPESGQVLIKVAVCGICHTELDEIEGRTLPAFLPIIPGHQVVGRVVRSGVGASHYAAGDRVGVAWIFSACGQCNYCRSGFENLCSHFQATGRDANGGYAEYMVANEAFCYPIPSNLTDAQAAPHLCAGAVGYRSLRLTGMQNGQNLGLSGFGASGHLVLKLVQNHFPASKVYVFSRSQGERNFSLELGAIWAGDFTDTPPNKLDAIIDTTPIWKPVVESMRNLNPGGRLVINAIRKENSDINYLLNISYPTHLWEEKEIKSVTNVTRKDVEEFLDLAGRIPILPEIQEYPFEKASQALFDLKNRKIRGAKVLRIE